MTNRKVKGYLTIITMFLALGLESLAGQIISFAAFIYLLNSISMGECNE